MPMPGPGIKTGMPKGGFRIGTHWACRVLARAGLVGNPLGMPGRDVMAHGRDVMDHTLRRRVVSWSTVNVHSQRRGGVAKPMKKIGEQGYSIIITIREGAAEGRPLPYSYPHVDSLGRLYLELLVMPLCVCIHKWRFDGSLRDHPRVRAHPRRMGGGGHGPPCTRDGPWG